MDDGGGDLRDGEGGGGGVIHESFALGRRGLHAPERLCRGGPCVGDVGMGGYPQLTVFTIPVFASQTMFRRRGL